jgi:ubiquinone/menaquinone biosynthesis C-methylase UbiE
MTQALAERTAEREGAFFLPHVQPSMRLLDVGCGPGSITIGFARVLTPGEVMGLDREPSAVEAARALVSDRHLVNLRFEVGMAEALPFPDASFTAVFAHTLLEHVPDPSRVLREMRRVLAPGGVIGVRDGDVGRGSCIRRMTQRKRRWRSTNGSGSTMVAIRSKGACNGPCCTPQASRGCSPPPGRITFPQRLPPSSSRSA